MAKHRIGRTAGNDPRIALTPRAEQHDAPRGRLFETMDTEQAMAFLELLSAPQSKRRRVLELA